MRAFVTRVYSVYAEQPYIKNQWNQSIHRHPQNIYSRMWSASFSPVQQTEFGSGSGSISQSYGSGSKSFFHQAKIVRKTLIPTVFVTITYYLWKLMKMYLQKVIIRKNFFLNFFFGVFTVNDEKAGSGSVSEFGSISQRHGSADPDPHQNVMDPQHWFIEWR